MDVLCLNFVKFGRRKIGEIVHCLADRNNISPGSPAVATARIAPKNLPGDVLRVLQISSKSAFGRVIAERVNTTT